MHETITNMKVRERIYIDTEFTQLNQTAELISLGLVSDSGRQFYCESRDLNLKTCNEWVSTHVIPQLRWLSITPKPERFVEQDDAGLTTCFGASEWIKTHLTDWLTQFGMVEIWGDCLAYDWMLFCELWGGVQHIPGNVFYIPFDLATLLHLLKIDPDISRLDFSRIEPGSDATHNALHDALIIRQCVNRLLDEQKTDSIQSFISSGTL